MSAPSRNPIFINASSVAYTEFAASASAITFIELNEPASGQDIKALFLNPLEPRKRIGPHIEAESFSEKQLRYELEFNLRVAQDSNASIVDQARATAQVVQFDRALRAVRKYREANARHAHDRFKLKQ